MHRCLQKNIVFNTDNSSWAANQFIRMISEGLCDTEDWSNDAENSALPYELYIKTNILF